MDVLLRTGLMDRLPDERALAYSLMSRYSGFLYQVSHDGNCMVAVVSVLPCETREIGRARGPTTMGFRLVPWNRS